MTFARLRRMRRSGKTCWHPTRQVGRTVCHARQVGTIPEIYYIPNWISHLASDLDLAGRRKEEEAEFFHIADGDMRAWEDMRTRSSQEWGAGAASRLCAALEAIDAPADED